jgi:hypothetical protein
MRPLVYIALLALSGCLDVPAERRSGPRGDCRPGVYPRLVMCPNEVEVARARLQTWPYRGMFERVKVEARRPLLSPTATYTNETEGRNASVAKHAALVALLEGDRFMAARAIDAITRLQSNWTFGTSLGSADRFIRIVGFLQDALEGFDLIMGGGFATRTQRSRMEQALGDIAGKLHEMWVTGSGHLIVKVTQNNYNTKLSTTLGLAALMLDSDERREKWLRFAATESNRFYGDGVADANLYLSAEGVCKEPPAYFNFGGRAAMPFAILYEYMVGPGATYDNDCSISVVGCKREALTVDGILRSPLFRRAYEWMARIQQPDGRRPSIDEGCTTDSPPGGALWPYVTGGGGGELPLWDFVFASRGDAIHDPRWAGYLLARADLARAPTAVPLRATQLLERSGQVIFRSGWSEDAIWAAVLGESGLMRSAVHNHADATSFQLYAFGEPLALDTGYFEPPNMDSYTGRQMTVGPEAHNLILVDGKGAPSPGLYGAGDVEATIRGSFDADGLDYAEVHATYRQVAFTRGVLFASERYLVIADALEAGAAHAYTWRLHGFGGGSSIRQNYEVGTLALGSDGAVWTRSLAKLKLVLDATTGRPAFTSGTFPHEFTSGWEGYHGYADGVIKTRAGAGDAGFLAVVFPQRAALAFPKVAIQEALDGVACISVSGGGFRDLMAARVADGKRVTLKVEGFGAVRTDADFFWLALDAAGEVERAFIRGGTELIRDGVKVIEGASRKSTAYFIRSR